MVSILISRTQMLDAYILIYVRRLTKSAWSSEFGSRNLIWAVLTDTRPAAYVDLCKGAPSSTFSMSEKGKEVQKKLWMELVEVWENAAPETKDILN
jgi:hypothetical protein